MYIVRCSDDTLYTGITTNLERRLAEHNGLARKNASAAYTRARRPVTLVYTEEHIDRSTASKRERVVKNMTRQQKLRLVDTGHATR